MKFGALLRNSAAELPELHQLFVSYKQLKKRLKRLPERQELVRQRVRVAGGEFPEVDVREVRQQEEAFVQVLDQDVQNFNSLFLDKEEDNVIRLSSLEDDAAAAATPEQVHAVYKRFVNFHGELLLMVHWSILAYTGLVKILKKHHKRTGLLVRAPHLDNLLSQPFCSVELTTNLITKAEQGVNGLIAKLGAPAVLSQHSPHASVQQLLHATKSLGELNAGSALNSFHDGSVELATSSDEDDAAQPAANGLAGPAAPGVHDSTEAIPVSHRKRHRAAAAGLPPNIMRQTRAALGLWEQLHETASTPSTVLAPVNRHAMAARTVSVGTDNSAA
ncbi:hypothetical protein WJX79_007202 [Trebouxia sp. C0005]